MPHLKSAWSAKTRYCRLVKPSGWAPRLLSSKSAYSGLQNNRHGQVLTHIHTPWQRNGKSLQRGMDLLLLVRPKIKSGSVSNESKWNAEYILRAAEAGWWLLLEDKGLKHGEKKVCRVRHLYLVLRDKHAKADHVKSWTSGNIRCIMPDRVYCLGYNFTVTLLLFYLLISLYL